MTYKTGLKDLIANKTPTFVDWTNDPTDAANITDGDPTTTCTTGNKVVGGGYEYAYFEWDLGCLYNVLCVGSGYSAAAPALPRIYCSVWRDSTWELTNFSQNTSEHHRLWDSFGSKCSKVRIGITADGATTITPNIREFHVWRL